MANKGAQEVIDASIDDIKAHDLASQHQILDLKIRRNSYALISKLPDDILLEIFALTQNIFPEYGWYREVTHICHRWRYIAVGASTLWTNPPLLRHDLAMLMLERSKSADLTICMRSKAARKTMAHALDFLGRIKTLEISLKMRRLDWMVGVIRTSRQPASRLNKIMLHCTDAQWDSRQLFKLSPFSSLIHSLRELSITNVIFDWCILPLHNLVSFKSSRISLQPRVPMQQFLVTLRQMPHLKSLDISISESQFSLSLFPAASNSVARVPLLHLTHLSLDDSNTGYVQWLLHRLTLPRLRRLHVSVWSESHNPNDNSSHIAHATASSLTDGDFGVFESLNWYRSYFGLSMLDPGQDDNPHFHFAMQCEDSDSAFTQASLEMFSLCRSSLSSLVELKIKELPLTVDEMLRLSTSLCSLTKIEIFDSTSAVSALIDVLATLPQHYSEHLDAGTPFPTLKSLVFSVIDLASHPPILEALLDCLMLRYEYGVAIQELMLFDCWVFAWQVSLFEEIVIEVDSNVVLE